MALNKLIINGVVKFDISDSTVEESNLLEGIVAYNRLGERIVGTASSGGTLFDDYLREPVSTDINHSTNIIKSVMDEGVVTTTFGKENETKVITSKIVPKTGNVDYVRTTKITDVNNITQIRETLEKVNKT